MDSSLEEVRGVLQQILEILDHDSGGYENQRHRVRELTERCLQILADQTD